MLTSKEIVNFLSGAFGADEVEDVGDLEATVLKVWCTINLNIARAVFPIQFWCVAKQVQWLQPALYIQKQGA